jgi:hypothetical protein
MMFPETAVEADRFQSVAEAARTTETARDRAIWAQDAEYTASAADDPGRLWVGILVALPFALAFWALVWLAVRWALRF